MLSPYFPVLDKVPADVYRALETPALTSILGSWGEKSYLYLIGIKYAVLLLSILLFDPARRT